MAANVLPSRQANHRRPVHLAAVANDLPQHLQAELDDTAGRLQGDVLAGEIYRISLGVENLVVVSGAAKLARLEKLNTRHGTAGALSEVQ
jgi:hypothetical protein